METLLRDVRYGLRSFLKRPGFTVIVVLTLALGIGVNTAIFSVVQAVLLRPLPFRESSRLMAIGQTYPADREALVNFSFRNFVDLREQSKSFERLGAYYNTNLTITGQGPATRLRGTVVTADVFPLLGANPSLGRVFVPSEDQKGGGTPAVISYESWQRYFGADPAIVGRVMTLDNRSFTVIGVMPAKFEFPVRTQPTEVWISTALDYESTGQGSIMESRGYRGWRVVGRLKPGVSIAQAQAEVNVIGANLAAQYPDANAEMGLRAVSLLESLVGNLRTTLLLLLGAVGVVLLIACANVANLLLERAVVRQRETTVRIALGASQWRITRQHLTESLLLSLAGSIVGVLFAWWGMSVIVSLSPEGITRISETRLDLNVLGFTAVISIITAMLFGLAPSLTVSGSRLAESLKEGGRSGGGGLRANRSRGFVVIAEIAMAVVLLVGAGLLIRSLVRLQQVALGFDPHNVLTMNVSVSTDPSNGPAKLAEFYRQVTERVKTVPGVLEASMISQLPLGGASASTGLTIEGHPDDPSQESMGVLHSVSPGYFHLMRIPIVKGREFNSHDDAHSTPVLLINETLARKFFPGEDPIGKHMMPGFSVNGGVVMREIVGIAGDVKHKGPQTEAVPEFYFAQSQMPMQGMTLVVRTSGDPHSITAAVRNEIQSLDKTAPVYAVRTAEEYVSRSVESPRFNMLLLSAFAAVALLLTVIGLYGVVSCSVSQATHEIGIHVALGAQTSDVLKMVIGQGMSLTLVGLVIGLAAAFGLTRLMSGLLFGVRASDPATFVEVSLLIVLVAMAACYVPARRAARVDPLIALRDE
ncbi:MAG TPA: ABC transporter permease [Pyrinomonadaceae bacterium]|nr:ABC transporter permease [Pyrinomonadaceae bacterium]